MASRTKIDFLRVKNLPTNRPLDNGHFYVVEKPNKEFILYNVTPDGEPNLIRGITDDQLNRLEQLTQPLLTKLSEDYSKSQIDDIVQGLIEDIDNIVVGSSAGLVKVSGTTLPTPETDNNFSIVGEGTYTKAGQADVVVPSGHMGILNWDGSEWYLGSSVEMPEQVADGIVELGDENAISGDTSVKQLIPRAELLTSKKNLFDKNAVVYNKWISRDLERISDTSFSSRSISDFIPVKYGEEYTISNWAGSPTNKRVVILTAKNYDEVNQIYIEGQNTITSPIDGYLVVYIPETVDVNNVQIELGSEATAFEPYIPIVRDEFIQDKVDFEYLINKGGNLYDFDKDIDGKYISSSTGALFDYPDTSVSEVMTIPEGAEFIRILNRTGSNGFAFIDSNGSRFKSWNKDGNEVSNFTDYSGDYYIPKDKNVVYFQITTKFNGVTNKENIKALPNGLDSDKIKEEFLPEVEDVDIDNKLDVTISGGSIHVNSYIGQDTIQTQYLIREQNQLETAPTVNIVRDVINGNTFKVSSDDIAPARTNGSAIGGNHGWQRSIGYKVDLENHGLTYSDIGSEYSDDNNENWVIWSIYNNNSFAIARRVVGGTSAPSGDLVGSGGVLSGGVFTSNSNLRQFVISRKVDVVVDGEVVVGDGDYQCDYFSIIESYDVVDAQDGIDVLVQNAGGYSRNMTMADFPEVILLFNSTINYCHYGEGKSNIIQSFYAYKQQEFEYHSFSQVGPIVGSSEIYVPKTLPYNGVDYTLKADWSVSPSSQVHFTPSFWEYPDNPPDRVLNFNGSYGIHVGYVPEFGVMKDRVSNVHDAIYLHTTRKIYPRGVSFQSPRTLDAGDRFDAVTFRNIVPMGGSKIYTSLDYSVNGDSVYMYVDYHKSGIDYINVPILDGFNGFEVVEKSDNVSLVGVVGIGSLTIDSRVDSGDYGFIVIKMYE